MLSLRKIAGQALPLKSQRACEVMGSRCGKPTGIFSKLVLLCIALVIAGTESPAYTGGGTGKPVAAPAQKSKEPVLRTNPFSLANIRKAQQALGRKGVGPGSPSVALPPDGPTPPPGDPVPPTVPPDEDDRLYTYLRFDPNGITGNLQQQIEADPTVQTMDFPFANAELYTDEFALDEEKAAALRDGWLYAVVKKDSPLVLALTSRPNLRTVILDELYLPESDDTELQLQAMKEAGYPDVKLNGICLLKRPAGFVRYWDNQFGRLEPVRNMQVWGLVFGIPLHTYTDANGHYSFPWRFSAGTIMGTHAKNSRVNVKPLNTHGTLIQVIPQLIANFIAGSIHIKGWVSSCSMRSDVNFDFYGHIQSRYWSQILNAVYFHDLYSQQQGILSAPTNNLIVYAQWANSRGFTGFGSASTPMLYHLTGGTFTDTFLGLLFDFSPTAQILSLLHGLLPDITFSVTGDSEPFMYEPQLAQTAFHELGHASHFRRVNAGFWLDLMAAEVFHGNDPCGYYGCGGRTDDGNVQVAESWAEYIGTQNALTRYPNGQKYSVFSGGYVRFDTALEREIWFDNTWIPTGIYNDLRDVANTSPEPWDNTGGASIQQLYNVFNSDVDFMCDYQEEFLRQNPVFARPAVEAIFAAHNITGCVPLTPPATHAGMTWRVTEQRAGGVVHVGSDAQTNPYNGDTPAATSLPVLCLLVNNSGVPAGIVPDFYNGWARGNVALSAPVQGSQLTSPAAADAVCRASFGTGWRQAEFHDGRYGTNLASIGGWSFWAFGNPAAGTRFWVFINDQPANPWN